MTIAEKITRAKNDYDAVYEAGKQADGGGNTEEAFEAGRKAEYDAYWNSLPITENGEIQLSSGAFAGIFCNDTTFKPNKNMVSSSSATYLFAWSKITNFKGILEQYGVKLDLSKSVNLNNLFYSSRVEYLPEIDVSSASSMDYAISACSKLKSIDKIKLKEDGSQTFTAMLRNCPELVDVSIEGVIGSSNINTQESTNLSHNSIVSIMNALSKSASGKKATFSKTAVNKAFETSVGANDGSTSAEWNALVATKTNWTISLV